VTNALLPPVRQSLPGFLPIEQQLGSWLEERFKTVFELVYAHIPRQGLNETARKTPIPELPTEVITSRQGGLASERRSTVGDMLVWS